MAPQLLPSLAMTLPRQILPGTTYLLTRRCIQRRFLLTPTQFITNLFLYLLAVAQQRYHIQIHAAVLMSNHYHLVLTDPDAQLPAFQHFLNSNLAHALNAYHQWDEYFWAPGSYNAVALHDPDTVMDKLTYVLVNPVQALLVERAHLWPGAHLTFESSSITHQFTRPTFYFRENGDLPQTATLRLSKPPAFAQESDPTFARLLQNATNTREQSIRLQAKQAGHQFLGPAKVLAQDPTSSPSTPPKRPNHHPKIACLNPQKRAQLLQALADFVRHYKEAYRRYRQGEHNVLFPHGTYKMRLQFQVRCASPP